MEKKRREGSERRRAEERRSEKRVRKENMQAHEKVSKSPFIVFFPLLCGFGGSQSRLAKAVGAEPSGQIT